MTRATSFTGPDGLRRTAGRYVSVPFRPAGTANGGGPSDGMLASLARARIARGDVRAVDWSLASFLAWLLVDSSWSLWAGGLFNVLMVNVPFAAFSLPLLVWVRARLAWATVPPRP